MALNVIAELRKKWYSYTAVSEEDPACLLSKQEVLSADDSEDLPLPELHEQRRSLISGVKKAAALIALALISFLAGWTLHQRDDSFDTPWDELKRNIRVRTVTFDPRFQGPPSEYMGKPNPDLDAKWYALSELRNFGVDRNTLAKINKTKAAVEYPGTSRHQVGLEAFHQLHCLNYIRMYTYHSYYEKIDYDMMAEPPEESREHKDHCIEVLRQRLMCNPDLNIYTYHWSNFGPFPYTDLHTRHQCIDWDAFYTWTTDNVMHHAPLTKPDGVEVV